MSVLVIGAVAEAAPGKTPELMASPFAATTPAPSEALQADFTAAAAEFHVPVGVLLALSYQETLWEAHQGQPSATGNYNVMALTSVSAADLGTGGAGQPLTAEVGLSGDPGIGRARAAAPATVPTVDTTAPALHTLDTAAALIRQPAAALRGDSRQNVRGGAALLASYQHTLQGSAALPLPTDPGAWYAAVARYAQAADSATATTFADRVYGTLHDGASRITDDNQQVSLDPAPAVVPRTSALGGLGLRSRMSTSVVKPCEVPSGLGCSFVPAAYASTSTTDPTSYGNYTKANRPADGDSIQYIVIHDTESSAASAINTFGNASRQASAHYVIGDNGSVTQMVDTRNVAWHSGNKTVNTHSIGIEHEGYALQNGSWYTEPEYQSSAQLTRYLAARFGVALDRQHVIGHDEVPGGTTADVGGMHWDPGPYWDWQHYMSLLGAPLSGSGSAVPGGTLTIAPPYTTANEPALTGCLSSTGPCPAHPANFVYLYRGPSSGSGLIGDPLVSGQKQASGTTKGWDWTDKAVAGQTFVVAAVNGDWTAIYYAGQTAWFYNPGGRNAYANPPLNTGETVVQPKTGKAVQVYGRTFPETTAYPAALAAFGATAAQQLTPLQGYSLPSGQAYVANAAVNGDYYYARNYNCTAVPDCVVVIGGTQYYPIRFNHRLAFVLVSDVQAVPPATPPTGTYVPVTPKRIMDTRKGTGVPKARVAAGRAAVLQITGANGVPVTGVTAVVLNVTGVQPTASTYVTVYPDGQKTPGTSNLNLLPGQVLPNLVIVPVVNGKVDLYNAAGTVDLLADLNGYYTSNPGTGSKFVSAGPKRIMDTRKGVGVPRARVGAGHAVTLKVAGVNGVPATGVTAVVLNVTAVLPTTNGYVSVYPHGQPLPGVSNLNLAPGGVVPNLVVVAVNDGSVVLYNAAGTVDLLADLTGYFTSATSSPANAGVLHTVAPVRTMDTRVGIGVRRGVLGGGHELTLRLGGSNGVPLNATAVVLNVTAVLPTATSYVSVFPYGQALPGVSNLNLAPGVVVPNLVVVPVVNGAATFYNAAGNVDLLADLTGFYTAG